MDEFVEYGKAWVSGRLNMEIGEQQDLFESGAMDSLTFNEFLADAETHFGFRFEFDQIDDWSEVTNLMGLSALRNNLGK